MERELLENLIEKNLSTREISKETGKSQTTVRHWLKKFDLKTNPNPSFEKVKTRVCKSCKEEFTLSINEYPNDHVGRNDFNEISSYKLVYGYMLDITGLSLSSFSNGIKIDTLAFGRPKPLFTLILPTTTP